MFVMTVDQRGSRKDVDRVDALLSGLSAVDTVRRFERTAGDEVQGVLDDPTVCAQLAVELTANGHWSVGIGTGDVERPLPDSTRAGRGPAFIHARDAVEAAKRQRIPLCVRGPDTRWCRHAQTAGRLIADVVAGRSEAGVEAVTLMRRGLTQAEAAERLGISPQAMSQRLRAAGWDLEADSLDLLADALAEADRATTSGATR
ncbi:helix-turn-helix transcriptional regulator [Gordonia aurantiaca]|uniref:helix-turn-helix transcriptional regulator n=1 Tax=Gordonia sp. B21 TaxID=3151852 RepID=UPI003263A4A6